MDDKPLPDALRREIEETAAFWRTAQPRHHDGSPPWTIYFIQEGDDGPIKVGSTKALPSRLSEAQTFNSRPIRLLAYFTGTQADERMVHSLFAPHRIRGEWFHPAPEVLDWIGKVANLNGKPLLSAGSRGAARCLSPHAAPLDQRDASAH